MANRNSGNQQTNAYNVSKQNQQSEMNKQNASSTTPGNFGRVEFGSETNVQEVKRQNQQSAQKKANGAANNTNNNQ
ncbi:MAG: gamma-type small acid-soluble spore protein [Paenisporosarcina sp.]